MITRQTFNESMLAMIISSSLLLAGCSDDDPVLVETAQAQYENRDQLDSTNFRAITEGFKGGQLLVLETSMFTKEFKWKLSLIQVIQAQSPVAKAQAAYMLSQMGVSIEEIQGLWDYPNQDYSAAELAAMHYMQEAGNSPPLYFC
ncbi:hypothetical protein HNW13_023155 [Shewanella sp. BF02_Schw]|uniref:hypothetical protein n=1 Tax=Shewanella sp. BF02_Schw TaxID=394908 RepID=UPI00177E55B7|nr:hypothetical protein [Shewanella sp. BF02_Schw]MBO1898643.1 hypothetical protein [Shewanella sp. BF02_Schw]